MALHEILDSAQAADLVEKTAHLTTKAAVSTGAATYVISSAWTIPDIAAVVGIVCTTLTAIAAITFQFLNYRLNVARSRADDEEQDGRNG